MSVPLWLARHNETTRQTQLVARIIVETGNALPTPNPRATRAGDPRRLRGIPALSRGVGSAIPGTTPGANL